PRHPAGDEREREGDDDAQQHAHDGELEVLGGRVGDLLPVVLEVLAADPVVGEPAVTGRLDHGDRYRHGMDATGSGATLRLTGLGKTYDDGTVAVQELDLVVQRGELVCLVGPSGCGKSTTLKMINRLIEPTTGTIEIDGRDVSRMDPVELRRGIGYVI